MASSNRQMLPGAEKRVVLREIAGIVLFVLAAFLLLSFTSFVDRGEGRETGPAANLCGAAGFEVARVGLFWFGYGAYLGVFILFTWSLALIGRRGLEVGPFRLLWFGVFLYCASGLMSHFGTGSTYRIPDPGGLVGLQISRFLETTLALGPWGTKLVLLMLVLITFQLATDFALYDAVVGIGSFLDERRRRAAEMVKSTGPLFTSLLRSSKPREAVAAVGGGEVARPSKRTRRAKEPPVEIAVTDEEVEGFDEEFAEGDEEEEAGRRVRRSRAERHAAPALAEAEEDVWDDAPLRLPGEPELPEEDEAEDEGVESSDDAEVELAADEVDAEAELLDGEGEEEGETELADDEEWADDEPAMLEEDPDSEVDPTGELLEKRQATIKLEPPKEPPVRAAGFDREATIYEPPPSREEYEYVFPSIQLLEPPKPVSSKELQKMIEANIDVLEKSLASYKVEAEVCRLEGLSGHADQAELLDWATTIHEQGALRQVALVHCEMEGAEEFKQQLELRNIGPVIIPDRGHSMEM